MGKDKLHRPVFPAYGEAVAVQALTGASTGTAINNVGLTTIVVTTGEGTAANLTYSLSDPFKGATKMIVVDTNSTKEVTISPTADLWGSTNQSITVSTGVTPPKVLQLVGGSSSAWILISSNSTTPDFTMSTG